MIFFRTGLIAALLIGLGPLGGPAWAQYDAPLYPPAPVSPSQPIPLNPDRAVRDPAAPTDATGPSRIDLRNGDSRNMAALPPEVRPETGPRKELPPQFRRTLVDYYSKEPAGTVIVDTPNTYLYLVLGQGKALRYGIGVGREGFTWSGAEKVSRKAEWPDWNPPEQMIERQPYLPRFMAGGDGNPLGARALYLGDTIYRIHGTNQPSTIGTFVSSGCIRLTNEDITDLHSRVKVGTRVVVLPGRGQATAVTTGVGSSGRRPPATNRLAPHRVRICRQSDPPRRSVRQSPRKTRRSASWKARPARFASLPLRPRAIRTPPDSRSRALVSRFRSSHHCAAHLFANFGIKGHTVYCEDLKFLHKRAAIMIGTSNPPH